ncbi:ATPase [Arthrobacter phage Jasmine]|uniref:AAA-ATPase n=1 Tax=Arthrobacter phage Jasmine TaxID=1772302 RepID=A0A0U4ILW4_9CAUD|nr:ATPase [Arthrobacter phage Jasmine]ALY09311.1 AAA-ATPase [Arthrobacter phage Jasmine]
MGEFDYEKPSQPLPVQSFNVNELLASMTSMEDEKAEFVGAIYGPAGAGKTTATMELAQRITPEDKLILYIFTNKGWSSLKNYPGLMKRVKKMPFQSFDQVSAVTAMLKNPQYREALKIGTVVFDEFNTMFDMDVEAICNLRHIQKKAEGKYKDPDTPEWPEYNTAKMHMQNILNDVLETPDINFMFICHPRFQKKTGYIEPDFFEKASQSFMRVMHSLYYLSSTEKDGKMHVTIQLHGNDQVCAKNRIGGLGFYAQNVKEIADAYHKWSNAGASAKKSPDESGNSVPSGEVHPPLEKAPEVASEVRIVPEESGQANRGGNPVGLEEKPEDRQGTVLQEPAPVESKPAINFDDIFSVAN